MSKSTILVIGFLVVCQPLSALSQTARVAFGQTGQDRLLPVEVTSDTLSVDQGDGTAIFTGNVVIGQGEMRLTAPRVRVVYLKEQKGIESLDATGGVTLVSGTDAAEAESANYNVSTGMISLTGNVLLVQGESAITGETVLVDTIAGTASVAGRVKTVLQPQTKK